MRTFKYYRVNQNHLKVNGEIMTPKVACKQYPEHTEELLNFAKTQMDMTFVCGAINQKIDTIFKQLNIQPNKPQQTFENAYQLFQYVTNHAHYDISICDEKDTELFNSSFNHEVNDIYRCLCQERSICTSDAAALSLLYRKAGLNSRHLTVGEKQKTKNSLLHEVVVTEINGEKFISDPTTIRSFLNDSKNITSNTHVPRSLCLMTPDRYFFGMFHGEIKPVFLHPAVEIPDIQPHGKNNKLKTLITFAKNALSTLTMTKTITF